MPEVRVAWTWETTSALHVGSGLSRPGVADSLVQRDHNGNPIIPGEAVKGALRMAAEQVAAWLGAAQKYGTTGPAEPTSWPVARLFGGGARRPRQSAGASDTGLVSPFGGARCTAAKLPVRQLPADHRVAPIGVDAHRDEAARARATHAASRSDGSGSDPPPTPGERPHVFTSTAIDRATGTAKDDTLRKTEFVPGGLQFQAHYRAGVAKGEIEVVETLLLASLAAVESVGGKAGIGWGRVKLVDVTVEVDGEKRVPTTAVTSERLQTLKDALSTGTWPGENATAGDVGAERVLPTESESTETGSDLQWFELMIELQEPTCLPDLPEFSNQVTTLQDCIPATTLRGALASYWRRWGRNEGDVRSWLSDRTAWTPALRRIDETPTMPAPRSFVTTKRAHGREPPVHDTFRPRPPKTTAGDSLQWRALAGGAIRWDGSTAVVAEKAACQTRMHVARDYRTGSKRAGALYARENLAPGTRFVAWACVPPAAFKDALEPLELLIGKRLSAGNGRATVHVKPVDGPQFFAASNPDGEADSCSVYVQLVAPAVIYDPAGYPRRTLDGAWWTSEFGGEGERAIEMRLEARRTATGRRGGWMGAWRHARAAVTTIDAGSVWRLCCPTPESAASLRERLRDRGHIGERTHEGLGWIVVDPPWLGKEGKNELDPVEPEPPKPEGDATPWPGVTISAASLGNIARDSARMQVSEPEARAYQEIAARVVRIDPEKSGDARKQLAALKQLCEKRGDRRSKWKQAHELLTRYCGSAEGEKQPVDYSTLRQRLLFELGILVTRGTPARH